MTLNAFLQLSAVMGRSGLDQLWVGQSWRLERREDSPGGWISGRRMSTPARGPDSIPVLGQ